MSNASEIQDLPTYGSKDRARPVRDLTIHSSDCQIHDNNSTLSIAGSVLSLLSLKDGNEVKMIGEGIQGEVYKVVTSSGSMAWKRVFKSEDVTGVTCYKELVFSILTRDHPYIVKILGVWDPTDGCKVIKSREKADRIGICYELGCSDLEEYIENYVVGSFWLLRLMNQMTWAVKYIHGLGVIHRDIKPNNFIVFLDDIAPDNRYGCVKLCDFGHSTFFDSAHDGTRRVCVYTSRAPELLVDGNYDNKIDIWSLGCTFLFMILNDFSFLSTNRRVLLEKILSVQREGVDYSEFHKTVNGRLFAKTERRGVTREELRAKIKKVKDWEGTRYQDVCCLIFRMLHLFPAKRPSCGEILKFPIMSQKAYRKNDPCLKKRRCERRFHMKLPEVVVNLFFLYLKAEKRNENITPRVAFSAFFLLNDVYGKIDKMENKNHFNLILSCFYCSVKFHHTTRGYPPIEDMMPFVLLETYNQKECEYFDSLLLEKSCQILIEINPFNCIDRKLLESRFSDLGEKSELLYQFLRWISVKDNSERKYPSEMASEFFEN